MNYEGLSVYNDPTRHVIEPIVENDFDNGCLADYDLISITNRTGFDFSKVLSADQLKCYADISFLEDCKTVEA